MFLDTVGKVNDFSPKFREELEEKVRGFGNNVRYKFDIGKPDPHPDNKGKTVYPSRWTLDPATLRVNDPYEDRFKEGKQKSKFVGLIRHIDEEKGAPDQYERVRLVESQAGMLFLDLSKTDDLEMAMFLELHPKLKNGAYSDPTKNQVIERIDEKKLTEGKRTERSLKIKAMNAASEMSDKNVKDFADALLWDSSEDLEILRGKIEEMAEATPQFFVDLVGGKNVEYQATVKRAMDKKVISFDPGAYKFIWCANQQDAAILQPNIEKNEVEVLAEWLQKGGEQATQVYKKIKEFLK